MKEKTRETLLADVEAYLAKGGKVTQMRDCSPKEAMYRSFKLYKDMNNPKKIYRKPPKSKHHLDYAPVVFSGYNSGKK